MNWLLDDINKSLIFLCGLYKGILEKKTIEEAMKMGAANATETIGYFGAWEVE